MYNKPAGQKRVKTECEELVPGKLLTEPNKFLLNGIIILLL